MSFESQEGAVWRVARFLWRSQNDPEFGQKGEGDHALVLWGDSLSPMFCSQACGDLFPAIHRPGEGFPTTQDATRQPGVIFTFRQKLILLPGAHVVGLGSTTFSKSFYGKMIRRFLALFFLHHSGSLCDQITYQLRRRWTDDQILASGACEELQNRIYRMKFCVCRSPRIPTPRKI